jgi:hypothetical protein
MSFEPPPPRCAEERLTERFPVPLETCQTQESINKQIKKRKKAHKI